MSKPKGLANVKRQIREFRDKREQAKELSADVSKSQPDVIALMKALDPEGKGIVFDPDDDGKGTAFVQQNNPSEVWDEDKILLYLRLPKRRTLRNACTTRVLDIRKWEAEVAAGNVPPKTAARMKYKPEPPAPFIRFGKRSKEGSIE